MAQKSLHFVCPHFLRMTNAMKTDEPLDPVNVGFLGAWAGAVEAHGCPDPIGAAGKTQYVEVTSFYEKEILHSLRIL